MLNGMRKRNKQQADRVMLRKIMLLGIAALLLLSLGACAVRPGFGPGWGAGWGHGWGHGWGMTSPGYGPGYCAGYDSGQFSFR